MATEIDRVQEDPFENCPGPDNTCGPKGERGVGKNITIFYRHTDGPYTGERGYVRRVECCQKEEGKEGCKLAGGKRCRFVW